jgi:hypothetical protein
MVQPSKKDLRKSVKGKTKAEPVPSKVKASTPDVENDESEWSDEDEDEENGGVSEKGMKRLMELVGEEDLDEYEAGVLAAQDGEEDEDEEEDEEDEDEDLEMASEEGSDEELSANGEEVRDLKDCWGQTYLDSSTTRYSWRKPTQTLSDLTTSNPTPRLMKMLYPCAKSLPTTEYVALVQ